MQIEMMVVVRYKWGTNKRARVNDQVEAGGPQYKLSRVLSGGFLAGHTLLASYARLSLPAFGVE